MTMPVSRSNPHAFPIEVTQDDQHYLVRIPASQKERATRIPGRRWNPEIGRWVYPKTLPTYDALTEEFKKDASVFDIRKPPNKRLPTPLVQPDEDDQSLDEWKDLNEKTSEIHKKFNALDEQISSILGAIRFVEDLSRETQDLVKARPESHARILQESTAEQRLLDPSHRDDLKIMQKALVLLAFAASGHDQSFVGWVGKHEPLLLPDKFVTATHEKLKASIAQILGESDYEKADFIEMIHSLKQGTVMGSDLRENARIGNLLFAMNQHRNRFSHQYGFSEPERLTRSIIYLFNLALVWPHVASEPVEENDET